MGLCRAPQTEFSVRLQRTQLFLEGGQPGHHEVQILEAQPVAVLVVLAAARGATEHSKGAFSTAFRMLHSEGSHACTYRNITDSNMMLYTGIMPWRLPVYPAKRTLGCNMPYDSRTSPLVIGLARSRVRES